VLEELLARMGRPAFKLRAGGEEQDGVVAEPRPKLDDPAVILEAEIEPEQLDFFVLGIFL